MDDKTSKFLNFRVVERRNIHVYNKKGEFLGWINYYSKWKKFVFTPYPQVILDALCLNDISKYLDQCTIAYKDEHTTQE